MADKLKFIQSYFNDSEELTDVDKYVRKVFNFQSILFNTSPMRAEVRSKEVNDNELFAFAESFVKDPKVINEKSALWKRICSNKELFAYFQKIIFYLSNQDKYLNKTPEYLYDVAQKMIHQEAVREKPIHPYTNHLVISMRRGLKLLSKKLVSLYTFLASEEENVVFRSRLSNVVMTEQDKESDHLLFVFKDDKCRIFLKISKYRDNNLLLTFHLLEYNFQKPDAVLLKKDNRISCSEKISCLEEGVCFSNIEAGEYELLFTHDGILLATIPLNISLVS